MPEITWYEGMLPTDDGGSVVFVYTFVDGEPYVRADALGIDGLDMISALNEGAVIFTKQDGEDRGFVKLIWFADFTSDPIHKQKRLELRDFLINHGRVAASST